ncbi:MAG TPA: PHP-associated domain-containing protein [Chloroflexota bacterium]|nr:PHP-associated domain-containing protein [Chloroflexota bacterium]
MGRADLHIHTAHSDGMMDVPALLAHAAEQTTLNVIAIADHDQVRGALDAAELAAGRPGGRLSVVVGTEISASWGRHLVALFFHEPYPTAPFPRFRGLRQTAARVRDAGGVLILPHALSALVPSVGERALAHLLLDPAARRTTVGIEVCSGVVGGRRAEERLRRLNAATWRLAEVGSSDAHHLNQVGSAFTEFPGNSTADLERALAERTTRAHWAEGAATVPLLSHAHQGWRSLVVKPARELRGALRATRRRGG